MYTQEPEPVPRMGLVIEIIKGALAGDYPLSDDKFVFSSNAHSIIGWLLIFLWREQGWFWSAKYDCIVPKGITDPEEIERNGRGGLDPLEKEMLVKELQARPNEIMMLIFLDGLTSYHEEQRRDLNEIIAYVTMLHIGFRFDIPRIPRRGWKQPDARIIYDFKYSFKDEYNKCPYDPAVDDAYFQDLYQSWFGPIRDWRAVINDLDHF